MSETLTIRLRVNGVEYERAVEPRLLLSDFLRESLGLTGHELFHLRGLPHLAPRSTLRVEVQGQGKDVGAIEVQVRIDTPVELDYFRNGGILQTVLRQMVRRG